MIELVTGHAGSNHIGSDDLKAKNRGTYGDGFYLLEGSANEVISPSTNITVPALNMVLNGWFARTDGTDRVTIAGTSQGMYRHDVICAKYSDASGIESMSITVKQGTAASTLANAKRPTLTQTATSYECPLYDVIVYQTAVQSVTCALVKLDSIGEFIVNGCPKAISQSSGSATAYKFASGQTANIGGFTAQEDGVYLLTFHAAFNESTASRVGIVLSRGTAFGVSEDSSVMDCANGSTLSKSLTTQRIVALTKNQRINLLAYGEGAQWSVGDWHVSAVMLTKSMF